MKLRSRLGFAGLIFAPLTCASASSATWLRLFFSALALARRALSTCLGTCRMVYCMVPALYASDACTQNLMIAPDAGLAGTARIWAAGRFHQLDTSGFSHRFTNPNSGAKLNWLEYRT